MTHMTHMTHTRGGSFARAHWAARRPRGALRAVLNGFLRTPGICVTTRIAAVPGLADDAGQGQRCDTRAMAVQPCFPSLSAGCHAPADAAEKRLTAAVPSKEKTAAVK
jgi:hypothetical protein